ncbi:MAG: M15 family metallopeptidase [Ruminococcus sp.]|nr:M15 family metallopeptidase [Ruminococcus sp.]
MSKKNESKAKSIKKARNLTQFVICAVVVAAGGLYAKGVYDNMKPVPALSGAEASGVEIEDIEVSSSEPEIDPNQIIFNTIAVPTKNKFYGDLILVNNDHEYFSSGKEDLVSIMEMNDEKEISYFTSVDYTYTILRSVYEPMVDMIKDFYDKYSNDTLIIYGSYRTKEFQEQLYKERQENDESSEAPLVAKPGFSEHETGYAFDFSESVDYDYEGTGDFAWINENSYKYGFIVRYTEEKEKITQIRPEPWHFRYVGIPHAYYMAKNDLCLEEYIQLLSEKHPYSGEHLEITTEDGKNYEVYFFASDDGAETTDVPVPTGYKYDISGNNVDGFIVTVHKDEKVAIEQEKPTEAAETTTESETTEVSSEEETENTEE